MRSKLIILFIFVALVSHPACDTGENCSFDIIGTWLFTLTYFHGSTETETFVFSGTSESGTVMGWSYSPDTQGTFAVTVCNVIQLDFNYVDGWDCGVHVFFSGNATSDTFFSGNFLVTNSCFGELAGSYKAVKM